ncbi:MAG: indole-3-glycerol phosphate synthase TrpC [Ginsengibacter sp.]
MNILDKIVAFKREELKISKKLRPVEEIKASAYYHRKCISLTKSLRSNNNTRIIAEFKRKSPSKGWFTQIPSPDSIVKSYQKHGAAAVSILTDTEFFGGSLTDLEAGRKTLDCPILRKDFMIDEYQFHEAKAAGADVILLIAAILTPEEVEHFAKLAHELGMEVLLEIHSKEELNHICEEIDMVGVNNRDLKTFLVDINQSIELSKKIPDQFIKISESGIDSVATIRKLEEAGFEGFLLGEQFMKSEEPGRAFELFTRELNEIV